MVDVHEAGPINSSTGRIARCIRIGRNRAAFWRALGFPNLVLAREARWRNHVPIAKQRAAKAFSPFATVDDLPGELGIPQRRHKPPALV